MTDLQHTFGFGNEDEHFEDHKIENGGVYWYASELQKALGYQDVKAFRRAINRAISACTTLEIPVAENFIQTQREVNGETIEDYKLTRFACYMVTMNGDPKKRQVAEAQSYFATAAESIRQLSLKGSSDIERVLNRDEVSEREKSLSGVAKTAGVDVYAYFQNAGYRGMYNMNLNMLRQRRGLQNKETPLDYMGNAELAGNLFRITQTEQKIKNENIRGQQPLENAAASVGRKVRQTMLEISGTAPEDLPVERHIKEVRKALKQSHKELRLLDAPKKNPKSE